MLRRSKQIIFILTVMLLTGCATVNTTLKDVNGRAMPDPHYNLQLIGLPFYTSFYYTVYEEIKDVDGSAIYKPKYLSFLTEHDIYSEKYKAITLTIEINNLKNLEYSLYTDVKVKTRSNEIQSGGEVNRSNMPYRQFVYQLPYGDSVRKVDYHMTLRIDNSDVMSFGNFRYNLIH